MALIPPFQLPAQIEAPVILLLVACPRSLGLDDNWYDTVILSTMTGRLVVSNCSITSFSAVARARPKL